MKYFIDTEFIEGMSNPPLGKRRHFIDLISIALVSEDGREYYAISNEYDYAISNEYDYGSASDWVKDNVIAPLYKEHRFKVQSRITEKNFHKAIGKSNKEIADDIVKFVNPGFEWKEGPYDDANLQSDTVLDAIFKVHNMKGIQTESGLHKSIVFYAHPEFYAYYADYDWVLFCSLFGTMMDLPKCFPMYCRDLKQIVDQTAESIASLNKGEISFDEALQIVKNHGHYPPDPVKAHCALEDARWNKKLYDFLKNTKAFIIKTWESSEPPVKSDNHE